ncbi:MAG: hypothetical protein AB1758_37755 [Candidatus Eremiobacterota bacterium]
MSKKKKKRLQAELQTATETESDEETTPSRPTGITVQQKVLSTVGFGLCGCLMAFLAGANVSPPIPGDLDGLARASLEGATLGSHSLDVAGGLKSATGGLLLGGSLGYSLFLAPLLFLLSWVVGGLGFYLLFTHTGSFVAGTVGWLVGSTPFMVGGYWTRQAAPGN